MMENSILRKEIARGTDDQLFIGLAVRVFANSRETWVQSQIESYQKLKKWYLMPPCLTLSFIRYGSRVKWSNPGKGVTPSPTPWCSSYRKGKGSFRVILNYGRQQLHTQGCQNKAKNVAMSWILHKDLWYGPTKLDNRISEKKKKTTKS